MTSSKPLKSFESHLAERVDGFIRVHLMANERNKIINRTNEA